MHEDRAQAKRAERCELTADWVLEELRKIAGANETRRFGAVPFSLSCAERCALTSFSISVLDSISRMLSHISKVAREAILSISGISSGSLAYAPQRMP
jgi:hypothetical protein